MRARIGGREVELEIEGQVRAEGRSVKELARAPLGASAVPSPYRSKLEAAFAQQLHAGCLAGIIDGFLYEPFTFRLAKGKRYRVDFLTWGEEGIVCYECKGYHKNMRDGLTHLKWSAQRFPFFLWRKVTRRKGQFEITDIIV